MNQLEIKFSNSTLDSKISTDITKIEKILENEPKKEEDGTMQFMKNLDYYWYHTCELLSSYLSDVLSLSGIPSAASL